MNREHRRNTRHKIAWPCSMQNKNNNQSNKNTPKKRTKKTQKTDIQNQALPCDHIISSLMAIINKRRSPALVFQCSCPVQRSLLYQPALKPSVLCHDWLPTTVFFLLFQYSRKRNYQISRMWRLLMFWF